MTESSGWLRGVEGVLSGPDLTLTVERLAEWQLSDGMMPWYPGGHADPWNHVEADVYKRQHWRCPPPWPSPSSSAITPPSAASPCR